MRFITVLIAVTSALQPGNSTSLNDTALEGCFSLRSLPEAYRIHDPLSWMECFRFCIHRLTTHMGVQQEPGQHTYNYCYCFGDVEEYLTAVNNASCVSCPEEPGYYCGGNHTLSVYRIRDEVPLSVVLATASGVALFTDDNSTSFTYSEGPVESIEMDVANDSIYLIRDYLLYRSYYTTSSANYTKPKPLRIHNGYGSYRSMNYDWQRGNFYFSTGNYRESVYFWRYDTNGFGQTSNHLNDHLNPIASSIDSYNNLLFIVTNKNVLAYSLNPFNEVKRYSNKLERFKELMKITLDTNKRLIYLLVKEDESTQAVFSITYEDTVMRMVYGGQELNRATTVDVFDDLLVWANKVEDNSIIYSCRLTPRCLAKDIKHVTSWNTVVNDLKIYHPDRQLPSVCERLGCTHDCSPTSAHAGVCTCPEGMELASDGKTCKASGNGNVTKSYLKSLGCFQTTFEYQTTFRIQQPLNWLDCMNICNNRVNKYVGIEAEESGSVFVHCYCNDFIEGYLTENSTSCQPISNDNKMIFGENGSVALYQLRDKIPLAVLLAAENGIQLYSEEFASPKLLVNTSQSVQQFDYNYGEGELFFITNNQMFRIIFAVNEGHLDRINLESKTVLSFNNFKHTRLMAYLSIDIQREVLYVVASEEENDVYIMSMNYANSTRRILFSGPELSDPFGLSELNGEIVWGNYKNNRSTIYRCKLAPTCDPQSLKLVYQTKERLYGLKIYHPNVQNITLGRLCLDRGCSHDCSIVPKLKAICQCPPFMTLSADDKTCIQVPPPTVATSPTTNTDDITTTYKYRKNLQRNSEATLHKPDVVNATKHNQTIKILQKIIKDDKSEYESTFHGNRISFIEIFVVCGVITIVVLMVVQTILIKKRNHTTDYACTYREASQIELRNTFPQ